MSSTTRDLFENDNESIEEEEQKIRVNKRYAKEYESRKQREELRNVRQEQGDIISEDSSTSESEDEDGDLLSPSVDVSILKTIHALRNKDESIYDPSNRFFPEVHEDNESSDSDHVPKEKKHTPKKFKDVIREQIVEQMKRDDDTNDDEKEDSADDGEKDTSNPLLYNQEQKELRSAFLESTLDGNDDGSDDWMVLKKRSKPTNDDETDKLIQQELEALEKTTSDGKLKDPRGEVEDGEKFLLDFIKNKKWIDKDQESSSDDEDERKRATGVHDSDDDSIEEVDRADDFESKYNFRFEQAEAEASKSGADFSVIGYARSGTMNTLRRKDETRKQKRLERKERKAAERKAKEEQLRRLKNAKREEMEQKLKQIKSVLGYVEGSGMTVDEAAMMKLMEGDYDPEKFEEIMNEAYGDDFYQQQDAEWKTDRDVRETLLRDEEDGALIAGLDDEAGGLYDNVEEDVEEEGYGDNTEGDGTDQNEEWDEEEHYNESDNGNQEETEMERKLREKMKEELYKLDYEDIVAGIPTRFKYRSVPKNNYGLSTEEILFAKDTTLKSFVSLKKMAPYREDGEYHVPSKKRRRFREMLRQDIEETMEELEKQHGKAFEAKQSEGEREPPKKKRRRQKKGKKKAKEGEDKTEVSESVATNIEDAAPEMALENDTKDKRKRKKKGRKVQKQQDEAHEMLGSNAAEEDTLQDADTLKLRSTSHVTRFAGDPKKSKKKKHKKKKKAKTVAVEGVSASRLASYNL